jgi:hypothetical protein
MIEKSTTRVDRTIATLQKKLQAQLERKRLIERRNSEAAKRERVSTFCRELEAQLNKLPDSDHAIGRLRTLLVIEERKQGVEINENA